MQSGTKSVRKEWDKVTSSLGFDKSLRLPEYVDNR